MGCKEMPPFYIKMLLELFLRKTVHVSFGLKRKRHIFFSFLLQMRVREERKEKKFMMQVFKKAHSQERNFLLFLFRKGLI